jgi:hypothetical protein
MNAGDKILTLASIMLGAAAGYGAFGSVLGGVFGVLAGIGALGLSLWIGDEINDRLRNHYRRI